MTSNNAHNYTLYKSPTHSIYISTVHLPNPLLYRLLFTVVGGPRSVRTLASRSAVSPHEKRQEMYVQIVAKQATEHKANVTALTRYRERREQLAM